MMQIICYDADKGERQTSLTVSQDKFIEQLLTPHGVSVIAVWTQPNTNANGLELRVIECFSTDVPTNSITDTLIFCVCSFFFSKS